MSAAVRERIERCLARPLPVTDPRERLLADARGPVSSALRALLEQPTRQAAVLIALLERPSGWTVLLTERAPHLAHHPGQVAFPGGRIDGAHEDVVAAALREAWEEVRLPPSAVRVAGTLPEHITGTGFSVTPVVGFAPGAFRPQPEPAEVAAAFEVPLDVVLEPGRIRTTRRERLGTVFRVHELEHDGYRIWGATASMLLTFKRLIEYETE